MDMDAVDYRGLKNAYQVKAFLSFIQRQHIYLQGTSPWRP
jgi:hypothetical protein